MSDFQRKLEAWCARQDARMWAKHNAAMPKQDTQPAGQPAKAASRPKGDSAGLGREGEK